MVQESIQNAMTGDDNDIIKKIKVAKNLLVYFHYMHAVLVLITIFYKNYYYFQVLNFLIMFLTKIMLNTCLVISNELIDLKN